MVGHSSPVTDDCTDLAAHAAGDRDAFARIYDRHAAVVLSFCRRVAGRSATDSEDAMQETFIRAHGRLDQVDDCRGFRRWVIQIASFVVREDRRRDARRTRHVVASGATTTAAGARAADASTTPAAAAEHHEDLGRLNAALDALPDDERLAIHLQYLDPDPVRAAASALGLSRSGYYKLLARARERLATLMSAPTMTEAAR